MTYSLLSKSQTSAWALVGTYETLEEASEDGQRELMNLLNGGQVKLMKTSGYQAMKWAEANTLSVF